MLHTSKVFRLANSSSGTCVCEIGSGSVFPPPPEIIFDPLTTALSEVLLLTDIKGVRALYKEARDRQLLLWAVFLFGALFAYATMSVLGYFGVALYVVAAFLCGDYLLCWPDGMIYDSERNVLYTIGTLHLHQHPEVVVWISGCARNM